MPLNTAHSMQQTCCILFPSLKCITQNTIHLKLLLPAWMNKKDETVENGLKGFYHYFFSLPHIPERTRKHIASPEKNSSCKRLNMYLRWMVRSDDKAVDFGIWKNIIPCTTYLPIRCTCGKGCKGIKYTAAATTDWQAALELTVFLRTLDKADPVKYDFALFGTGVMENKTLIIQIKSFH